MKKNYWLILGTMIATGAIAQSTNTLPDMPAPITTPTTAAAPAPTETATPKPAKKKVAAPKKISEPTVKLVAGPAEVATKNLNVRGQAGLKGEFIAHITNGDTVVVLDQIDLAKHAVDEPSQWAKIALPSSVKVWVSTSFIDATNKVVLPKKLNLRAGPGENYSVLGVIEKGTPVTEVSTKGDWMQIEAPSNSYAFVAAMYLKQEASGTAPTNLVASSETEPTATTVTEPQAIVTEPTTPPQVIQATPPPVDNATAIATALADNSSNAPRIVSHEGVVGYSVSVQAPSGFKLYDLSSYATIDYLYTTAKDLDLNRYVNMRVVVTGTEGLDERWPETPVLTIQRIVVLDTNAVPVIPIKHKH